MNNISPPYSRERKRRTMREGGRERETMAIITVADTHSLSLPRTFPAKRKTKRKEGGLERRRDGGKGGGKAVGRRHKTGLATRLSLSP